LHTQLGLDRHWAVKVEQSLSVLSLQEGANSTLRCNFSASVSYVQWFQQNPGGSLISLFFIASGMKQNERLSSTVNSKERYSTLHITASQLEDSATYLCAVEAQCPQGACSLYPNCSGAQPQSLPQGRLAQQRLHSVRFPDSFC
uniref:Ig-like domain-containing protein n=1 Tax=Moschus moschiferus TaxID=68415 RepID=A0A8C6CZY2_MOSMO